MTEPSPSMRFESAIELASNGDRPAARADARAAAIDLAALTHAQAVFSLAEAEDTYRAIAAGEVDSFIVSDGTADRRVFTLSTADRPYRMFVENMRDGAATLSSSGLVMYANR
ncbi:MAG: domain S-box, partial [Ilumatobacteraceae bacterium]|nr:domain S-box [Ilumatobacteraceae bacterium]